MALVLLCYTGPHSAPSSQIDLFSSTVQVGNATSALLLNTFRPIQPYQKVTTNMQVTAPPISSGSSVKLASANVAIAAFWAFRGV